MSRGRRARLYGRIALLAFIAACADTTPPWDLTHDRLIAVRAEPPMIEANGRARLDALAAVGAQPVTLLPMSVVVAEGLPATVMQTESGWDLVAGSDAELSAAGAQLPPGTPLVVELALEFELAGEVKRATKSVVLGATATNPTVVIEMNGEPVTAIVAPLGQEIEITTEVAQDDSVDWFTSTGELSDYDDPAAHLTADVAATGQVVCVRRDGYGGVGWAIVGVDAR